MIEYGTGATSVDEYGAKGALIVLEWLKRLCIGNVKCFKHKYLRPQNEVKTKLLLQSEDALGCYAC